MQRTCIFNGKHGKNVYKYWWILIKNRTSSCIYVCENEKACLLRYLQRSWERHLFVKKLTSKNVCTQSRFIMNDLEISSFVSPYCEILALSANFQLLSNFVSVLIWYKTNFYFYWEYESLTISVSYFSSCPNMLFDMPIYVDETLFRH